VSRRAPHIACFAPYTDWSIHSARQVTILQALRQRGCTVTYVTCDGAFSDCDLYQPSTGGPGARPADACSFCQARVATRLAGWGMAFHWLSRWLAIEDRRTAAAWVGALKPADYPSAHFNAWALGAWVKSSVHRHLRHNVLDLTDAQTTAVYGSYLYSGVLAAVALERLFAEEKPDAQLLFNGRMGPTRIALELAKARGIRTICEERGYIPGRMMLFDNVNSLDVRGLGELWTAWRDLPLSADEIAEIGATLSDRWHGRSTDISQFSAALGSTKNAVATLGLDPARETWALYTSSLDEATDLDTRGEAFPSQYAWIDATVDFVRAHPDLQLVIRTHPNAGSKKSLGRNDQDLAYFAALPARLPPNVKLVPSDSAFGSYDLAMAATLGLIWRSTIGLEMAAMGHRVMRVGNGPLAFAEFIRAPTSGDHYAELLSAALENRWTHRTDDTLQAWRFAHVFFYRWSLPFPLVNQPKWYVGEMAYDGMDALAPGQDAALDHICDVFMNGRPLFTAASKRAAETTDTERTDVLARIAPYRLQA